MRRPSSLRHATLAVAAALALASGCSDDSSPPPADGPPGIDAATDAPPACNLPPTRITCTVGNDAPCTAVCSTAYCYNFTQLGVVCTKPCSVIGDCPQGWTCNNMGRCRPPA